MAISFTASQHGRGWQGPLEIPQPNPLSKQGHPEQGAQHRGQAGLEYLQRRFQKPRDSKRDELAHPVLFFFALRKLKYKYFVLPMDSCSPPHQHPSISGQNIQARAPDLS